MIGNLAICSSVGGAVSALNEIVDRIQVSILGLLIATVCLQPLWADVPIPDNPEKVLRVHGVAITEHAVVGALRSNNAEVRKAASDVITKRWPSLAPSVIKQAMSKESDGFTRIRMATDLARLGDTAGREALVNECHNRTVWGSVRVGAAFFLSEEFRDSYSCLDAILDVLQSDSDPRGNDGKWWALALAPNLILRLNQDEAHKVFQLVLNALGDPNPGIRSTASMMLFQIGDPAAISSLEAAIAKEKDEQGRLMMINDLRNLKGKQQMQQK